ncbi:MAG: hypothetical protein ACRD0K_10405 [Egibacteraceae bacterium]
MRIVTELEIRREALALTIPKLVCRLQTNWPNASLAAREVQRWQALISRPYDHNAEALAGELGVESVELLGLAKSFEAARWRAPMTPDQLEREMLNRRNALKGIVMAGATIVLPVADIVASAQHLHGVRRVGGGHLDHAQDTATRLAVSYAAKPNADARFAAEAHAYSLLALLKLDPGKVSDRRRLLSIASDAASLAGSGQLSAGRFDKADFWFTKARELAHEAGDRRLEALAIASFASIAWALPVPDHTASVEALTAAAKLQGFLQPAERAYVLGGLGCERAALGDDLVSGRFLEQAHAAAALIPLAEPGWGWWSIHGCLAGWDGIRREVHTAGRSMWLGRPAEAVGVFEAALPFYSPVGQAMLRHHLTNSCVALGDPERACAHATAALDGAKAYELGTISPKVRQARRSFHKEWIGLAVVRELDERLRLAA